MPERERATISEAEGKPLMVWQLAFVLAYLHPRRVTKNAGPDENPDSIILEISAEEGKPGFIRKVEINPEIPQHLSPQEVESYKVTFKETLDKIKEQVKFQGMSLIAFQVLADERNITLSELVQQVQQRVSSS